MNIAYKSIMNDHTDSLEPFRTIFNQEEEDETQLQQQAQQAHFELDPIELGDDDYYMGGDGGDDMGHQQSVSEPLSMLISKFWDCYSLECSSIVW